MSLRFWITRLQKKNLILLTKKFPNKVGLIHGGMKKDEKDIVLKKFLNKDFYILFQQLLLKWV